MSSYTSIGSALTASTSAPTPAQLVLYMFKTLLQMYSFNAKSLSSTKEFYNTNPEKIIMSLDSTASNMEIIEKFTQLSEFSKQRIVKYIDNNFSYYICKTSSKPYMYFYIPDRLEIFMSIFTYYLIIPFEFSTRDIFKLASSWDQFVIDNKTLKYVIIKILFGSTTLCGWASEDIDIPLDINSLEDEIIDDLNADANTISKERIMGALDKFSIIMSH